MENSAVGRRERDFSKELCGALYIAGRRRKDKKKAGKSGVPFESEGGNEKLL